MKHSNGTKRKPFNKLNGLKAGIAPAADNRTDEPANAAIIDVSISGPVPIIRRRGDDDDSPK